MYHVLCEFLIWEACVDVCVATNVYLDTNASILEAKITLIVAWHRRTAKVLAS
jgi:hypothetical protein